jgi:C4-dicarboxylate-specific signal transduction histidine kinase
MPQNQLAFLAPSSLERVLDKNEAIQETVEQSAAEMCLSNTVLKHEVPQHLQTGEVAEALQKTDELETRIQNSADDLAQVNEALKEEISARAELERQLESTQAELEEAQSQVNAQEASHGSAIK